VTVTIISVGGGLTLPEATVRNAGVYQRLIVAIQQEQGGGGVVLLVVRCCCTICGSISWRRISAHWEMLCTEDHVAAGDELA
jgi:hypothetical protein